MGAFDDLIEQAKKGPPEKVPHTSTGVFDDLIRRVVEKPPPKMETEDTTSSAEKLLQDFLNQGVAAGQRTTPNIAAHAKNFVSSDTYENDAGQLLYKDPASGELVPTDSNKHVALKDPSDGKIKVFNRTDDTNEGTLSSLGRILGTGMAAGAPTARAAIGAAPEAAKAAAPSLDAIHAAADASYNSPAVKSLVMKPSTIKNFGNAAEIALSNSGHSDQFAPGTFGIVRNLQKVPDQSFVTGDNINTLRKMFRKGAASSDPSERAAAQEALGYLDDAMTKIPKSEVVSGDLPAATAALEDARGNAAAAFRAENVDTKMETARARAAVANSGKNVANNIRARMADIYLDPKAMSGYSDDERAMIKSIVYGTPTENAVRWAGNMMGGSGPFGAASAAFGGSLVAGPVGAALPLGGYALKALSNKMTLAQADRLSELLRSRAPVASSAQKFDEAASAYTGAARNQRTLAMTALAARNLANNLRASGLNVSAGDLMTGLMGGDQSSDQK
jgi:hypothetical protein